MHFVPLAGPHVCVAPTHSSTSTHGSASSIVPLLPELSAHPALQAHTKDPLVSVQLARGAQLCVPRTHSSALAHTDVPSPSYPALHTHEYDPTLLLQAARREAHALFPAHSSTSWHIVPLLLSVSFHPALHAHTKDPLVSVQLACGAQLCVPRTHSAISEMNRYVCTKSGTRACTKALTCACVLSCDLCMACRRCIRIMCSFTHTRLSGPS
jgi:hypothetical protein